MSKHAELRSFILSLAKVATQEGVRSSMLTARELILGSMKPTSDLPHLATRHLGALMLLIFMPIIAFLAGRRSGFT